MKKIILTLAAIFCFSTVSYAADSMTQTLERIDGTRNMEKYKLTLSCTTDSGGDLELSEALSTSIVNTLHGFYLYSVTVYPGGTAPTDNSDLTITAVEGTKSVDILGGNGTDIIDATTTKETIPSLSFSGLNLYHLMDKENTYTVASANNAVVSATFTIELIFIQ